MIIESIVTTKNADGSAHIAPMGVREVDGLILLAPFRPSTTLENFQRERAAVVNLTDDVRVFAGCLTGRYDWATVDADACGGLRLVEVLTHRELRLRHVEDDELRPRFFFEECATVSHAPFKGFNRAQAAVIELAILVSRLHMLPAENIDSEIAYLRIALDKTAGPREEEAWGWLMERVLAHPQP